MFPLVSLQGHLHDRYGQLVSIYTRLLLIKISFHIKVRLPAASTTCRARGRGFTAGCAAPAKVLAATAEIFFFSFYKAS